MGGMMTITRNITCVLALVSILMPSLSRAYVLTYDTHITVTEEYNDNIYQDPDDEVDDFITLVSPGFMSQLLWQKVGLRAAYDLGFSYYDQESDNDSTRHHARVESWWSMSQNTQVSLSDTWIRSEDLVDMEDTASEQNRREQYDSNTASLNMNHRFGERRNISLGYSHTLLNYDSDTSEDNQSHNVNGAFSYFFSRWIGIESSVGYTRGLYDVSQDFDEWIGVLRLVKVLSRQTEVNVAYSHSIMTWDRSGGIDIENDYQVYNPSVGIRHTTRNDATMDLNIGYFVQDIEDQHNEKGLTFDGNIGKTWTFRRGMVQLEATSGYEESQLRSENLGFTVYYGANASGLYTISREISMNLDCSYRNNDYVNTGTGSTDDRTDKIFFAVWRVNWDIKRWLRTSLQYSYHQNDSNEDVNDYTENRVLASLTITPFQKSSSAGAGEQN